MWAQPHECTNLDLSTFIKFYAEANKRFQNRVVSFVSFSHILALKYEAGTFQGWNPYGVLGPNMPGWLVMKSQSLCAKLGI